MKHYLLKLLLFLSPILLIVGTYVILDPFKVIWHYDNYYANLREVIINRGYVSTQVFDNQNDTCHYDSFILGNSTSLAFHIKEWQQHIGTDTRCFHFDAMSGSVEGLLLKVKHIDKQKNQIKNALILIDHRMLERGNYQSHIYMQPPSLTHNQNFWKFHWVHFVSFLNTKFFKAYIDYRFNGKLKPYMKDILCPRDDIKYDGKTNEIEYVYREKRIADNIYYEPEFIQKLITGQHPDSTDVAHINGEKRKMFTEIANIFKRHHTRVKVVISPFWDQIRLNPTDLKCLQDIFGKENVYNFSGPNKWNADYHNYYDNIHYRPQVATEILNIIYTEGSESSQGPVKSESSEEQ